MWGKGRSQPRLNTGFARSRCLALSRIFQAQRVSAAVTAEHNHTHNRSRSAESADTGGARQLPKSRSALCLRLKSRRKVGELTAAELQCLAVKAPALRAALTRSATATDEDRERMKHDPSLVYQAGREYGTRHWVFRRTNLPCLRCAAPVRQLRQGTHGVGEEERDRIIYFCENCQELKRRREGPEESELTLSAQLSALGPVRSVTVAALQTLCYSFERSNFFTKYLRRQPGLI